MAKEGKLTNVQVMEQLMEIMTAEQKQMVANTMTSDGSLPVNTEDGKVCRKAIAHTLLECYQHTTGEDTEQVELVKKGLPSATQEISQFKQGCCQQGGIRYVYNVLQIYSGC